MCKFCISHNYVSSKKPQYIKILVINCLRVN
nr:MAG TPA: hypothetical protein [Caudoviricetes sp.]